MGQGRGCGGILTIRPGGFSWHSQALNCDVTQYKILEEEHEEYKHYITYQITRKNKECKISTLELGHGEYFPSYVAGWEASGFFTQQEYENRESNGARYSCALVKNFNPKNNPEPPAGTLE